MARGASQGRGASIDLRDWTERHRGFWEFIKFNVLSNVSTIVRFALMWAGYVLCERVVEGIRRKPT